MFVLRDLREKGLLPTSSNLIASHSSMIYLRGNRDYSNNHCDFLNALVARFSNEGRQNVVTELSQLRQTGAVVEFQAHFKQLKSRVLGKWPDLHEGLLADWFMGGLKK
ncbi:hypothetical protein LguiA_016048 [Lonicera macranthoides]